MRLSTNLEAVPSSRLFQPRPSMGLKLLRDGMDSANLVSMSVNLIYRKIVFDQTFYNTFIELKGAMYSVSGQRSWNFFKNDLPTHVPTPGIAEFPLALKFTTGSYNIQQVSNACCVLWINSVVN